MKWPLVSLFLEEWCVAQKSVCNNDDADERGSLAGARKRGEERRGAAHFLL
jgi:hypothetical protein